MIFEEWFDNMLDTYPDDYYGVAKDAWNAAIAARDEELRKQEPVAYTFKQEGSPAYTNNPSFMKLNTQYVYEPLYAAPIPPEPTPSQQEALRICDGFRVLAGQTNDADKLKHFILARPDAPIPPDNHDWKAEYLRQVDLHNQTLDELREAEMQLRNPAPTPPTPSQQEAQWQPIETAPKDGTGISIKLTDGSVLQNVIPQSDGDYWWNGVQELFIPEFKVTHWMPLPTRPDEVTK